MRRFCIASLLFALCPVGALAADDVMAGTYGNTLIATGGIAETHIRRIYTHLRHHRWFYVSALLAALVWILLIGASYMWLVHSHDARTRAAVDYTNRTVPYQ